MVVIPMVAIRARTLKTLIKIPFSNPHTTLVSRAIRIAIPQFMPFITHTAVTIEANAATSGKVTSISPMATIQVNPSTSTALMQAERIISNRLARVRKAGDAMEKNTINATSAQIRIYCGSKSAFSRESFLVII
jgi:hypothetical protein